MLEFVSFETAKLAFEKGIKGNYYIDNNKYYQLNYYKYNEDHFKNKPRKIEYGGHDYENNIYAFTLYELQKKLREEYNIIVESYIDNHGDWYYDFYIYPQSKKNRQQFKSEAYKTLEEALDAGLYNAMKKYIF